jgi:hypothetical protein
MPIGQRKAGNFRGAEDTALVGNVSRKYGGVDGFMKHMAKLDGKKTFFVVGIDTHAICHKENIELGAKAERFDAIQAFARMHGASEIIQCIEVK